MATARAAGEAADHADIRATVRRLCAGFPGRYWQEKDAAGAYPGEFVAALAKAGLLAALIPEEFGGSGLPLAAGCAILEEIQRSGANAAACHAQIYTMGTLAAHGSPKQKRTWLPAIASGALRLQAFAVTEPDSGSDTTALTTFARRQGGRYIVNGRKVWTSRAEHSDLMLLLARTTPLAQVAKKSDGLSVFLVDMRQAKGLAIQPLAAMVNHATTEIAFDNLAIPASALIGEEGQGFRYILSGMNAERILIAAECIGDARFFIDRAVAYANQRRVFGRPIGQNQGIQFPIAQAFARTQAAALTVAEAARRYQAGENAGAHANMAKMLAADASWEAADMCLQTHGGFGFARAFDIERKFRETRLYRTAPISTNLILAYLAEHVLGLPRSY